uniref:Integrase n=1 Tax=Klebsiella pneumoniae TaxID=573 RepID=A0A2L1KSQ8_KLEPN|nr:integrase [Klebsiella pneumoniae]
MSFNDSKIRKLKPYAKPYKVSDPHGLYLLIKPGGSRHWYLKYRINGKESRIARVPILPFTCLMPASSAKVSVRCWR